MCVWTLSNNVIYISSASEGEGECVCLSNSVIYISSASEEEEEEGECVCLDTE